MTEKRGYSSGYPDTFDPFTTTDTPTIINSPPVYASPLRENSNPFVSPTVIQTIITPGGPTTQGVPAPEETKKKKKKGRKMHPFVKGIVILTASPFVMAGACVAAGGAIIYGTGQLIVGVGDVLTGGPLKKTLKKAWDERHDDD